MNPRVADAASKVGFDAAKYTWFDATVNEEISNEILKWGKEFLPNWNQPTSLDEYQSPFEKLAFVYKDSGYVFTYEKDIPLLQVWSTDRKNHAIVEIEPSKNKGNLEATCSPEILTGKTDQENFAIESKLVNAAQSLLHLVCLINMRAHRLELLVQGYQAKNDKQINAKRLKKNKSLIFSWSTIELKSFIQIKREPQGGTHASPARHKRRGHLRKKRDGSFTWIPEMWVGSIENGLIVHDYIADKKLTQEVVQ